MSLSLLDPYQEAPPSQHLDLLRSTLGQQVTGAEHYTWEERADLLHRSDDTLSAFSVASGPLLVRLADGRVLGFGSQPSQNSVTVWLERAADGLERSEGVVDDPEFHPLSIDDLEVSDLPAADILGHRVQSWELYRGAPERAAYQGLPNERALVLRLDSGARLVMTHGLPGNSDDFFVLNWQTAAPLVTGMSHQILFE